MEGTIGEKLSRLIFGLKANEVEVRGFDLERRKMQVVSYLLITLGYDIFDSFQVEYDPSSIGLTDTIAIHIPRNNNIDGFVIMLTDPLSDELGTIPSGIKKYPLLMRTDGIKIQIHALVGDDFNPTPYLSLDLLNMSLKDIEVLGKYSREVIDDVDLLSAEKEKLIKYATDELVEAIKGNISDKLLNYFQLELNSPNFRNRAEIREGIKSGVELGIVGRFICLDSLSIGIEDGGGVKAEEPKEQAEERTEEPKERTEEPKEPAPEIKVDTPTDFTSLIPLSVCYRICNGSSGSMDYSISEVTYSNKGKTVSIKCNTAKTLFQTVLLRIADYNSSLIVEIRGKNQRVNNILSGIEELSVKESIKFSFRLLNRYLPTTEDIYLRISPIKEEK